MDRRLAAILAADVVGYSRFMEQDEAATLAALKSHRAELIDPLIAEHNGRLVKLMGDGALVEFASVVDTVACAIAIQNGMPERNAGLSEPGRIVFRIGVHLGDVMIEDDDLYGDGVNVAARLEGLAEPGGICLSQQAFDQVETKLDLQVDDLGEQQFKNIARPVRAYRLRPGGGPARRQGSTSRPVWLARRVGAAATAILILAIGAAVWWRPWAPDVDPASLERMAFPLPEKPSIAVLPFNNLSGDPEQTYLSDGVAEDVITDLSRFKQLFVIARNSSFAYKGEPVKVRKVAEELGVQYVLEGSVQRTEDSVRVTAQLIDAMSGFHIWAERYDESLADVLSVQDEITQAIVATVASQILGDVQEKLSKTEVKNFSLWDYVLRARAHHFRFTKEDNRQGMELLVEALKRDSDFAPAHWRLAWAHYLDFYFRWSDEPRRSLGIAHEHAQRAVDLQPANYQGHWVLGRVSLWKRHYDQAEASFARALELNPSNADLIMNWANTMVFLGRAEEALPLAEEAMRLNPVKHPDFYSGTLAFAQFFNGRYDDVVATLQKSGRLSSSSRRLLAASYAASDRIGDAQPHVQAVLDSRPNFSVTKFGKALPFKKPDDLTSYLAALRKAGLLE